MLLAEKLQRLNELAKKKKTGVVTNAEIQELTRLRAEYLTKFRAGMKTVIENTKIIDPQGQDVTPKKVKQIQAQKK